MSELTVLAARGFRFHGEPTASVFTQITQIRFRGVLGLVREKCRGYPGESFHMSSNTRLGHKVDGNRMSREVLELAIRKGLFVDAAAAVRAADALDREVLKSPRWAQEFAHDVWSRSKPIAIDIPARYQEGRCG